MITLKRSPSGVFIDTGKTLFFEELIRIRAADRPTLMDLIRKLSSGKREDHLALIAYSVRAFGTGIIYQEVHHV